jgi:hypothetical protein
MGEKGKEKATTTQASAHDKTFIHGKLTERGTCFFY